MNNREDLIEYISKKKKKPGEYTLTELMDIGVEMKKLPRSQISWPWLHNYLGVYGFSSEAYRLRVLNYTRKNNMEINKEENIINEDPSSVEFREKYYSKTKEREWVNAYRRAIREEVRIDNLKDEIQLAVSKLSSLPIITPNPIKLEEFAYKKEAILLLSDLHIGVDCDNYYNKYDNSTAKDRLEKLVSNVSHYCKINNAYKLNILNLGDCISGIIHTSSRIEQSMDVIEQVMTASELIAQTLNALSSLDIIITYRSVFDNHSRVIADKNQHIEKEQFSRIIDWYLKERLKGSKIAFINDNIDGGIGRFKIFNKTIMFAHGHSDSRNGGFQNFIGLTREWVDYICLAHYHNPATKDFQGCKVFINGSVVGTEQYAFGKRLFSKPSQKLIIFEENNDNIIDIDILLG